MSRVVLSGSISLTENIAGLGHHTKWRNKMISSRKIIVFILPMFLMGCEDIFEKAGTTSAFSKCVIRAKEQGLKESTSKVHCSNKHQRDVDVYLSGHGAYYNYDNPWFEAKVTNTSSEYIVTAFTIVINASDQTTLEIKSFDNVWIEPKETRTVAIYNEELKYKPKAETNTNDKWGWRATDIKGLKLNP